MPRRFAHKLRLLAIAQGVPLAAACLLWLCGLSLPAAAQYRFDHWTINDGLPNNAINAIVQTSDGYLWLATNDGLARFDGIRFAIFNHGNTPGIGGNRFFSLYEDRDGALWAGSENSILYYREGKFRTYTTQDGLPNDEIYKIEEGDDGRLWISGLKTNIALRQGERFLSYSLEGCLPGVIYEPGIRNYLWWSRDELGLHFFQRGHWFSFSEQDGVLRWPIRGINQDQYDTLWIATEAGMERLRPPFAMSPKGLQGSSGVLEDRKGNRWFPWGQVLRRERNGVMESFPDVSISAIVFYEDHEGTIWVGTGDGLYRANEMGITTLTKQDGLPSNWTYSVLQDRTGAIWIGMWGGGVSRYRDGRFTHFLSSKLTGLYSLKVTSLYEDRAGVIWIGTVGGMCRFQDGKLTRFSDEHGLAEVWATYQDRAGDFWFGTSTGVTRFRDGNFTVYTTRDGLPSNDVKALLEDRNGALWVGTYGGLARWQEGRFAAWTESDGLSGNRIRCLYEDHAGVLWIGTYDGGLTRLKDGRLTRYTVRDGLFGNGVFQILDDGRGNFWMSCNQGIFRVRQQELNDFAEGRIAAIISSVYGTKDGMANAECNGGRQPTGWRTVDGKLWFPTLGGLAILDPASFSINPVPPPVVIEECRLSHEPVAWHDGLKIESGHGNLEIQYTANSLIKPEQVKFKYKLAGLDTNWIEAGNRRIAYYRQIPPGTYTFTVLAANSDGVWNTTGRSLRIIALPPFWRTWWFLLLMLLLLTGLVQLFYYQDRVRQLKKQNALQAAFARRLIESQEQERKRIATGLHDSLSHDLVMIHNTARQGSLLAVNAPGNQHLSDISELSSQALAEVKEIIYNLRPHNLEDVGLTGMIRMMFRKASGASGIHLSAEFSSLEDLLDRALPPEAQIHLYRVVQEGINNIVKHSQATAARLTVIREDGTLRLTLQDNGRGFETPANGADRRPGLGLTSMSERMQILGGQYELRSVPGEGTTITIKLHLPELPHD